MVSQLCGGPAHRVDAEAVSVEDTGHRAADGPPSQPAERSANHRYRHPAVRKFRHTYAAARCASRSDARTALRPRTAGRDRARGAASHLQAHRPRNAPSASSQCGTSEEASPVLDSLQFVDRALAGDVAGVERALRLQEHDVGFLVSGRKMLDAARNDDEFARMNDDLAFDAILAHLHAQPTLDHEEQLVFVVVVMPHELSLQLHKLHVKVVHLAHDLRAIVIGEQRQLLRHIALFHTNPPQAESCPMSDSTRTGMNCYCDSMLE